MMTTFVQATQAFLRNQRRGPRRRSSRTPAISPGERLERRGKFIGRTAQLTELEAWLQRACALVPQSTFCP